MKNSSLRVLTFLLLWCSNTRADESRSRPLQTGEPGSQLPQTDEPGSQLPQTGEPGSQLPQTDEPGSQPQQTDEPGILDQPTTGSSGFWSLRDRGPRMKFGYRTFSITEMGQRSAQFHLFSIDRYFISRIFRGAGGLEGGFAQSSLNYLFFGATLAVGIQYPCRLSPFIDVVSSFGLARREAFHQNLFGFSYHFGIEAGIEFYVLEQLLLSLAMGWRRPVLYHKGNDEVEAVYLYYDSYTLKVGLGF